MYRPGFILVVGSVYAALAELLYRIVLGPWPESPMDVRIAIVLTLVAAAVLVVSSVFLAHTTTAERTIAIPLNAGMAAAAGAFVSLLASAIRLRWGMACNQCDPVGMMMAGMAAAALAAAAVASLIGRVIRAATEHPGEPLAAPDAPRR